MTKHQHSLLVDAAPFADGRARSRVVGGEFRLGKRIGRGSCGQVFEARSVKSFERVAVKVLECHDGNAQGPCSRTSGPPPLPLPDDAAAAAQQEEQPLSPLNEAKFLRALAPHPNVVALKRVVAARDRVYLVQELCDGDLFERVLCAWEKNGRGGVGMRESQAAVLFTQLVRGVQHLHRSGVAHRDIKAENCLMAGSGRLVLTDLGFATRARACTQQCGTLEFMAPEVVQRRLHPYDPFLSDVWSCGVVLFSMLTARLPFHAPTNLGVRDNIVRGRVLFPEGVGADARELVRMLLTVEPSCRPSLEDVLAHPFLANNNTAG